MPLPRSQSTEGKAAGLSPGLDWVLPPAGSEGEWDMLWLSPMGSPGNPPLHSTGCPVLDMPPPSQVECIMPNSLISNAASLGFGWVFSFVFFKLVISLPTPNLPTQLFLVSAQLLPLPDQLFPLPSSCSTKQCVFRWSAIVEKAKWCPVAYCSPGWVP